MKCKQIYFKLFFLIVAIGLLLLALLINLSDDSLLLEIIFYVICIITIIIIFISKHLSHKSIVKIINEINALSSNKEIYELLVNKQINAIIPSTYTNIIVLKLRVLLKECKMEEIIDELASFKRSTNGGVMFFLILINIYKKDKNSFAKYNKAKKSILKYDEQSAKILDELFYCIKNEKLLDKTLLSHNIYKMILKNYKI